MLMLRGLLYYVECATIIVYCNILKEVRLGGWGHTRKCVRYYPNMSYYIRLHAHCNLARGVGGVDSAHGSEIP